MWADGQSYLLHLLPVLRLIHLDGDHQIFTIMCAEPTWKKWEGWKLFDNLIQIVLNQTCLEVR